VISVYKDDVVISAKIGQDSFLTIFGYTSPTSSVELLGKQVGIKTLSNQTGYFEFTQIIVPKNLKDVCISATDTDNRPVPPTCISLPPIDNQHRSIGAILLAPSISTNNNNPRPGQEAHITGQSIPNQKVEIKLFPKKQNPQIFPKEAFAAENQISLITTADQSGNYSLSLPTTHANSYLIKSQSFWQDNPTPPSFQIAYQLPDYKLTILQLYPALLPILLLQIVFIPLLLFLKHKQKIVHNWPAIYPKSLWQKP